jgi:hypothetical protein
VVGKPNIELNEGENMNNRLPWIEKLGVISINPEAADRNDIAEMAADLLDYKRRTAFINEDLRGAGSVSLSRLLARTRSVKDKIDIVLSWELEDHVRDELTTICNETELIQRDLANTIGSVSG